MKKVAAPIKYTIPKSKPLHAREVGVAFESRPSAQLGATLFNEIFHVASAFSEEERFVAVCDDAVACAKKLPSDFHLN